MSSASGARVALLATAIILAVLAALPAASGIDKDCTYTIYTRTGSVWRAQTYSKITVTLTDAKNVSIKIDSLGEWGNLRGSDHTPFQNGALDVFSSLDICLEYPICSINITSDGEGSNSGWYLDYLEVTAVGAHLPCNQKTFNVDRWIAYDTWPFSLEYIQNDCNSNLLERPIKSRLHEASS